MQPKAGVLLKGNLKSAEIWENLKRQPTSQHAMTTQQGHKQPDSAQVIKAAPTAAAVFAHVQSVSLYSGNKHKHGISSCHAEVLHSEHSKHCI